LPGQGQSPCLAGGTDQAISRLVMLSYELPYLLHNYGNGGKICVAAFLFLRVRKNQLWVSKGTLFLWPPEAPFNKT